MPRGPEDIPDTPQSVQNCLESPWRPRGLTLRRNGYNLQLRARKQATNASACELEARCIRGAEQLSAGPPAGLRVGHVVPHERGQRRREHEAEQEAPPPGARFRGAQRGPGEGTGNGAVFRGTIWWTLQS